MKPFYLFVLLMFIASCEQESVSTQAYMRQEGIVKISVATRGSYQFILQPDRSDSTKNYLVTNYTDSLKSYFLVYNGNVRELPIIFSGITSLEKRTVYHLGPTDGGVPAYDLPTIQLTELSRR